jgi:hypothetical protein
VTFFLFFLFHGNFSIRSGDKNFKGHSNRMETAVFSVLEFQYEDMSSSTAFRLTRHPHEWLQISLLALKKSLLSYPYI